MEFSQAKKKKLDFEGNSFNVPNMATRFTSEGFGDDEESSRDSEESISSATSIKSQETVNVKLYKITLLNLKLFFFSGLFTIKTRCKTYSKYLFC